MNNSPEDQNSFVEKFKAVRDSNDSDKNYNAIKALISSIPTVGSLTVGLWESRIPSPAMERLYIFLEDLAPEFDKLKSKIELVDFESPAFQTVLISVYQIVIRTHQEQKLQALRNIVLNSSIPSTLEDNVLEIFLNWINGFTPLHISTLKCLHYMSGYTEEQVKVHFPMLEKNKVIYNHVLKDLEDKGLISLKENYITTQEYDNHIPQRFGYPIAKTAPDGTRSFDISEKEIKMKTSKERENIDDILAATSLYGRESKTTKLGEQFIEFIEYPSIA